ncbi:MAG TPA: hypothetical protein PKI20_09670 [Verrucomicrobiota bacterium]|nr:hypothetical protein [Verrucomicrobiota bacterium]HQL77943.1 hypothetical protein [Verrucomicrobiota bacterium]
MLEYIQPLLADAVLTGLAFLAVVLVGYLWWLHFREKRQQRRLRREQERSRKDHWGYV